MRRPAEHPDHELVGFAREPQPDEQDDDRAERAQRVGDDQRQHRLHVDHQFLGFLFQHPDLVARPRRNHKPDQEPDRTRCGMAR